MPDWKIFKGTGSARYPIPEIPAPPPWRSFSGIPTEDAEALAAVEDLETRRRLGATAVPLDPNGREVMMINAAILLRRALVVTGKPGVGKSSLAYMVARELGLGPVLRWPISTRTTLQDGLYHYDALARLQATQAGETAPGRRRRADDDAYAEIGRFVQLGPLGTALLPRRRLRILLIDEIDKSDIDLPNDLLTVLEEGNFRIPELARFGGERRVRVRTADHNNTAVIVDGNVTCSEFPLVIMTSNGERDFPPAFLRRCLRLDISRPDLGRLRRLVEAHLGNDANVDAVSQLIEWFNADQAGDELAASPELDRAPDQLLNAVFIIARNALPEEEARILAERLFHPLGD